ncbi:MAG: 2-hydroxyacyl-CoA dehydratase [bacterium]
MVDEPKKITLKEWNERYTELKKRGLDEPFYGGPLQRHVDECDFRLLRLLFDNSPSALRLWNFLLTEEERLAKARSEGKKLIGIMKDLGTVPVMVYSFPEFVAFYPDGAWWIPCIMEMSSPVLNVADRLGIDESFCPVRAMLGAFLTQEHFPIPDMLISSVGAVCDDFSVVAQRLEGLGFHIIWWEIPHRRKPEIGEKDIVLPGGLCAPKSQVDFVLGELKRIRNALEKLAGHQLKEDELLCGIKRANQARKILSKLREVVFSAKICPMPALEMLIAEMLIIHFCSDREETISVLQGLLDEVLSRVNNNQGILPPDAVRVFWINPVADLRVMNLLERCGGRICGTDYLFPHAIESIPEEIEPLEALAQMALSDVMVGTIRERSEKICEEVKKYNCEAIVISRIPGASHCAFEGRIIRKIINDRLDIPIIEFEVPPISDGNQNLLRTRIEALIETVKQRRN